MPFVLSWHGLHILLDISSRAISLASLVESGASIPSGKPQTPLSCSQIVAVQKQIAPSRLSMGNCLMRFARKMATKYGGLIGG